MNGGDVRALEAVVITRLHGGGRLVIHADGLAAHFFAVDPSSIGVGAYDALAGKTAWDRIEKVDVEALNRTMRARSPHVAWESLIGHRADWLEAIPPELDLIETSDHDWLTVGGDDLVRRALTECVGPGRGVSVATKMLHLKRPRLFPVLDSFVAQMLGGSIPEDGAAPARVHAATELAIHLRREGRINLDALHQLQHRLAAEGIERSLVRILDAALWLSHPAAGLGVVRSIEVKLI